MIKKILYGLLALVLVIVAFGYYKTLQPPEELWSATHQFPACPSRPSCVSSMAQDEVHKIAPLQYAGDGSAARQKLETVIKSMTDAQVLEATPEYLHVLFLTPTMRFHDDMELLVQAGGVIQVRSLSRFGYRDHGVNRARVEALRQAFDKAQTPS